MVMEIPAAFITHSRDTFQQARRLPEENLIVAILLRAIKDLFHSDQHVRRDALAYFLAKDKSEWSFHWCCSHINLNPSIVTCHIWSHRHNLHQTGYLELVQGR